MRAHTSRVSCALAIVAGLLSTICPVSDVRAEYAAMTVTGGITVDAGIEPYKNRNGLSGKLSIAGSDTMSPVMSKLAAQFISLHPGIQIAVENVGSNAAIREFQLGHSYQRRGDKVRGGGTGGSNQVELLASSRELTEEESRGFESNHGYRPIGIPIAMDAVAIYVHKDNPIQQLTLEEVDAIFGKEHKRGHSPIVNWGQVGISEGPLGQQSCHLYGRDRRSATRAFFKQTVLKGGELKEEVIEQPGSASEIIAIAQDPLGIGYAGVGFQIPSVRPVPIAAKAGDPGVLPSQESVLSGTYPLSRPLYLYVKNNPKGKLSPLVEEFLSFVNSQQGQQTVARANLYPLTGIQVTKNRQELGLVKVAMAGLSGESGQRYAVGNIGK